MEKNPSTLNQGTEVKLETGRDEQYAEQFWKRPGNTDKYKEVLRGAILS